MKKLLLFIFLCIHSLFALSQIALCSYYNQNWGKWSNYNMKYKGTYDEISFYQPEDHPSDWQWKFTINNYKVPSKKELKAYRKRKEWLTYYGTFEYYIDDNNLSIQDMIQEYGYPIVNPKNHRTYKGDRPCKRKTVNAIIRICPYKKHPVVYNIFFEGVGLGIDLKNETPTFWQYFFHRVVKYFIYTIKIGKVQIPHKHS